MPKNRRTPKLPVTSPWLEKWSKSQTEICLPESYPSRSLPMLKSTKDVGTQTPPSLLFVAIAEERKRDLMQFTPPIAETRTHRNSPTDWMQMGRDLRLIADDLKLSTETLDLYTPSPSSTSNISSSSFLFVPKLTQHYQRRRSLPDSSSWPLRRP